MGRVVKDAKIYGIDDLMEFLIMMRKAKCLKILEHKDDCNVMICKIDGKIYFLTNELFDYLREQKVLY